MKKRCSHLPSMEEIVTYLENSSGRQGKREIARAFNIKGEDRISLKNMLKELTTSGVITKDSRKRVQLKGFLPETCPIEVTGEDSEGKLISRPLNWYGEEDKPQIIIIDQGNIIPRAKIGDFLLARVKQISKQVYEGSVLRRLSNAPDRLIGIFTSKGKGLPGMVSSIDRRFKHNYFVDREDTLNAEDSSIVIAEIFNKNTVRQAKIIKVIGKEKDSNISSLISIYLHNLPLYFSSDVIKEARLAISPTIDNREDLREYSFVTIDGEDARDFDDAVWAEPYSDKDIKSGWHLIIAISDVSWFVRVGSGLDISARERGNSVYFPDRAIHMLPEELSSGLSSLIPDEDRACLVAHIWIDDKGKQRKKKFNRAMIRSSARLNYHEVQDIIDGKIRSDFLDNLINNLYGAYKALDYDKQEREALNIISFEREIELTSNGTVKGVKPRERLESHKIIEEFMIAANVAAAEVLEETGMPVIYRVHEPPSNEKVSALNDYLTSIGIPTRLPLDPSSKDFNKLLKEVKGTSLESNINEMVLRTQSQARYSSENYGHFGLALNRYAHFTSPIRRYADLMVHRSLVSGLKLGEGGLDLSQDYDKEFKAISEQISYTERRADIAERDAEERYIASFLSSRVGEVFSGVISGVNSSGLFIRLKESYAEGFSPISTLPDEYYVYDNNSHSLIGQNSGRRFSLGQEVEVILREAVPITGGILLEIVGAKRFKRRNNFQHNHRFKKGKQHIRNQGNRRARHNH